MNPIRTFLPLPMKRQVSGLVSLMMLVTNLPEKFSLRIPNTLFSDLLSGVPITPPLIFIMSCLQGRAILLTPTLPLMKIHQTDLNRISCGVSQSVKTTHHSTLIPHLWQLSLWMIQLADPFYFHQIKTLKIKQEPQLPRKLRNFTQTQSTGDNTSSFSSSSTTRKMLNRLSPNHLLDDLGKKYEVMENAYWSFKDVIAHQGPLTKEDPHYKGSSYNVMIEWDTGETTYGSWQ